MTEQVTEQADKETRSEMQEFLQLQHREYFRSKVLNQGGLLKLTIPDKPTSPKQKYYTANLLRQNTHVCSKVDISRKSTTI
ncbi:Fic family protein [Gracilibacillus pellucidus]|uniref:Fic family protein n=1 Tax=Gracilibacillus pellucidus TaxID=3095368 RepID=UPI0039B6F5DA